MGESFRKEINYSWIDPAQEELIKQYLNRRPDVGLESRYVKTRELLKKYYFEGAKILDLGANNVMRSRLQNHFQTVIHGTGNLDLNKEELNYNYEDIITSFEVFEHLYNLFPLLREIKKSGALLICSVPLRFPFSKQYWTDDYHDRHYNEFEERQFFWILKEAGFEILEFEKWYWKFNFVGVRPFLRSFLSPSWVAVVCK